MPSPPPCGISISALKLYEVLRMLGASPLGVPVSGAFHVNTLRPAVMLGRGVMRRVTTVESSGSTWYFAASFQKRSCSSLTLAGHFAATSYDSVQSFLSA